MIIHWLMQQTTVEEAEQLHMVTDDRLGNKPMPFGFQNREWIQMRDNLEPGDELWIFEIPADSRDELAGWSGIAVVRSGKVKDHIRTSQICL